MNILDIYKELEITADISLFLNENPNTFHSDLIAWNNITVNVKEKVIYYNVSFKTEIFTRQQYFTILGIASHYKYTTQELIVDE